MDPHDWNAIYGTLLAEREEPSSSFSLKSNEKLLWWIGGPPGIAWEVAEDCKEIEQKWLRCYLFQYEPLLNCKSCRHLKHTSWNPTLGKSCWILQGPKESMDVCEIL